MRARLYTASPQQDQTREWDDVAPVRGMDGTVPLHDMPEGTAVFLYNMIPADYGVQTRAGYRTWTQELAGTSVRSLIPFLGQVGDFSTARLFAVTPAGIFDVTAIGQANPPAAVSFTNQSGEAGFCKALHFTNPNGEQILLVADEENGLYEYDPTGAVWTKYTNEITFPDATTCADIAFITSHKGRIWLIPTDSADAYYLPVGAKNGAATKFQFGSKMARGGYLVGIYDWSTDGGEGLDDYLVAIGKGGDVLVYRGTDPAQAASWNQVGRWFIGEIPAGRRIAKDVGGDTLLLSAFGVTSTSALLSGIDPTRVEKNVSGKITRLVRASIREKSTLPFWELELLPDEGVLSINTPVTTGERKIQFVLNTNRVSEDEGGGWGMWRDLPANSFANFGKQIYFGTETGEVCQYTGSLDGVNINGVGGTPVNFSGLGRFTHVDAPSVYKQVMFMRPQFLSNNALAIATRAVYDYDLSEPNLIPVNLGQVGDKWDEGLWDEAIWSGTFSAYTLQGGSGYGREMAMFLEGQASARATWISTEILWQPWQFL